jgi:hypothetical protein
MENNTSSSEKNEMNVSEKDDSSTALSTGSSDDEPPEVVKTKRTPSRSVVNSISEDERLKEPTANWEGLIVY